MLGALLYLRLTSLKNQIVTRAKRLRQPKYFLGALAGLAYFYFIFFRHLGGPPGGRGTKRAAAAQALNTLPAPEALAATLPLVAAFGALLLLVIAVLAWLLPSDRSLRFTEAEIAFLFPAPVTRRALINFKLLSSQFSILFTSLFFTLISNRWSFLGGNAVMHAFGWWFVLSTLNLHYTGAALTISRLSAGGVSPRRRRLLVLGGVLLVIFATLAWVWSDLRSPDDEDVAGFAPFTHYLLGILDHGVLGALLIPCKFILGPFLAPDARAFFFALAPALLVVVGHYAWVLRLESVSFEEASLALAEKRAAAVAAVREGKHPFGLVQSKGRPAPFFLADTGRPELAFLWKNLLSTLPYFNVRVFAIAAAVILVGSRWFLGESPADQALRAGVMIFAVFAAAYILVFGPHLARQDLRSDLQNADVLKTYPLPGWQLLLGEMLTPLVILTGLAWLALFAAVLAFPTAGRFASSLAPGVKPALALGLAVLTPLLSALQLLVLNGATLIFPAWFQATRGNTGGGGIELMGQRLIFFVGQLLVMLVAVLPAALGGASVFGLIWLGFNLAGHAPLATAPGLVCAALVILVVLAAEIACALWWLGQRFERLDVSAELRP
ncbi:MAG: hypothetical protein NTV51_25360 [Verrucomicrobia bacterium]|nr:hypothetical protein [Verrucomicrobiota bacterium]